MIILIDTRLWGLALKAPYYSDYDLVKETAGKARNFVYQCLQRDSICLSSQLLAEIYHVLTDRGKRLPKLKAEALLDDILQYPSTIYRNADISIVQQALTLSAKACIHLWDFLIVLPFKGEVEKIYTTDPHFKSCKELQIAEIENPLGVWEREGMK